MVLRGMNVNGYSFLGDHPYLEEGDPLGYDSIVARLATLISDSSSMSPFVVGVEGPWGIGKTSTLGKLQRVLAQKGHKTVSFNAWSHEGKRPGSEALLKTVLASLDDDIVQRFVRFDRNQKVKRFVASLLRIPVVSLAARVGLGNPAERVWDKLEHNIEAANDFHARFEEAMTHWAERNEKAHPARTLVIFVDEIDRCSDSSVLEILTTIKLYLTVPGCIFVVGYDRMAVAELLHSRVATASAREGAMYLEKMIQIPFSIPHPDKDRAIACLRQFLEAAGISDIFSGNEEIIVEAADSNPRRMKRFINVFLLRWLQQRDSPTFTQPHLLALLILLNLHDRGFSLMVERNFSEVTRFVHYLLISRSVARLEGFSDEVREIITEHRYIDLDLPSDRLNSQLVNEAFPPSYPSFGGDPQLCDLAMAIARHSKDIAAEEAQRLARVSREAGEAARPPTEGLSFGPRYPSVRELIEDMSRQFRPDKAAGANATIQFHFTGSEPGDWTVTVQDGACSVEEGSVSDPTVTINAPSDVWLKITNRELDGATAFMSGQFTFTGDMGVMMQMQNWFGGN